MYKMHVIYLCEYEKFNVPFSRILEKIYLLKCFAYLPNYIFDWNKKLFEKIDIKMEIAQMLDLEDTNLEKHKLFFDLLIYQNEKYNLSENDVNLMKEVLICYFEKDEEYFMPINQYMIETFEVNENSTRDINKYYIDVNERYNYRFKNDSDVMIEFSSNYDDIKLNIDNNTDFKYIPFIVGGAQKFRITQIEKGPIHFNVSNPHKRTKGNYIIRYYYTDFIYEYIYSFDTNNFNYHIDISNNDNLSFSITFNNINITSSYETFDPAIEGYNITFYVYAFLYPKKFKLRGISKYFFSCLR